MGFFVCFLKKCMSYWTWTCFLFEWKREKKRLVSCSGVVAWGRLVFRCPALPCNVLNNLKTLRWEEGRMKTVEEKSQANIQIPNFQSFLSSCELRLMTKSHRRSYSGKLPLGWGRNMGISDYFFLFRCCNTMFYLVSSCIMFSLVLAELGQPLATKGGIEMYK